MTSDTRLPQRRLPDWLKTTLPGTERFSDLKTRVRAHGLNTVCESASCPNLGTCWDAGTLTLMILGDRCSRACRFCDVETGHMLPPNPDEPNEVAAMLAGMNHLKYVVITSVDRDDLQDGGAGLWAETVNRVRQTSPHLKLETLIPDFKGSEKDIGTVCEAEPDILSHNMETVKSLQSRVRPQCSYDWSLDTLRIASSRYGLVAKSGLMLGHGETEDEVIQTMRDLLSAGVRILTLGQYLRPTKRHIEVIEYIHPGVFARLKQIGESMGFDHVESGPLVRSSYLADKQARQAGIK